MKDGIKELGVPQTKKVKGVKITSHQEKQTSRDERGQTRRPGWKGNRQQTAPQSIKLERDNRATANNPGEYVLITEKRRRWGGGELKNDVHGKRLTGQIAETKGQHPLRKSRFPIGGTKRRGSRQTISKTGAGLRGGDLCRRGGKEGPALQSTIHHGREPECLKRRRAGRYGKNVETHQNLLGGGRLCGNGKTSRP